MNQKKKSNVLQFMPGDTTSALNHFYSKLCYETDPYDVYTDLQEGIENIVVVDARSRAAFEKEHVPGAISLPHREMNALTTSSLSADKVYVVYCEGIGCNSSTKGAAKLTSLGFKAKEMLGGLDWWKRDGYATESKTGEKNSIDCGC